MRLTRGLALLMHPSSLARHVNLVPPSNREINCLSAPQAWAVERHLETGLHSSSPVRLCTAAMLRQACRAASRSSRSFPSWWLASDQGAPTAVWQHAQLRAHSTRDPSLDELNRVGSRDAVHASSAGRRSSIQSPCAERRLCHAGRLWHVGHAKAARHAASLPDACAQELASYFGGAALQPDAAESATDGVGPRRDAQQPAAAAAELERRAAVLNQARASGAGTCCAAAACRSPCPDRSGTGRPGALSAAWPLPACAFLPPTTCTSVAQLQEMLDFFGAPPGSAEDTAAAAEALSSHIQGQAGGRPQAHPHRSANAPSFQQQEQQQEQPWPSKLVAGGPGSSGEPPGLTHVDAAGRAAMVDVSQVGLGIKCREQGGRRLQFGAGAPNPLH